MIEGQSRGTLKGEPADGGGIVGCSRLDGAWVDFGDIYDADDAAARVTARITEGAQLAKFAGANAGLLEKLPPRRRFESFFHVHKAARQRPLAGKRLVLSLHKQDAWLFLPCQDHEVNRHGRTRVVVDKLFPGHGFPVETFAKVRAQRTMHRGN
jgi:hypothetical protein